MYYFWSAETSILSIEELVSRIIVRRVREDECHAISHWNGLNKIIVFDPFLPVLFALSMYTFSISYLRRCFHFEAAHGFIKLTLFQISAGEGFYTTYIRGSSIGSSASNVLLLLFLFLLNLNSDSV